MQGKSFPTALFESCYIGLDRDVASTLLLLAYTCRISLECAKECTFLALDLLLMMAIEDWVRRYGLIPHIPPNDGWNDRATIEGELMAMEVINSAGIGKVVVVLTTEKKRRFQDGASRAKSSKGLEKEQLDR